MKITVRPHNCVIENKLRAFGASTSLARFLSARNIKSSADFTLGFKHLLPYGELKNIYKMVKTLHKAIQNRERITILSDYDADGATACAVAYTGLSAMGANVNYIIPHRIEHSYGLTVDIAKVCCEQKIKPKWIFTVDNGISSFDGIKYCNEHQVNVLVTDHHMSPDVEMYGEVPAYCIVNPNQTGCQFESKAMAGCGVAYYVMWALMDEIGWDEQTKENLKQRLLPFVAIGTVADVVTLDKNNRILVNAGLNLIRSHKCSEGVKQLAYQCKLTEKSLNQMATSHIAFGIGPRINAAGRLESMETGVNCLLSMDPVKSKEYAQELTDTNSRRKLIESDVVETALVQIMQALQSDEAAKGVDLSVEYPELIQASICLADSQWHQGVIGIAAGRLKEKFNRPTFIFTKISDTELKGSGRSIEGLNLRDALDLVAKKVPGALLKYGGHAMAAGATVSLDKFLEFKSAFEEICANGLTKEQMTHCLETDGAYPGEVSMADVEEFKKYPWGQQFPEPCFVDTFKIVDQRLIGDGQHLKLTLEKDGQQYNAIKFKHYTLIPDIDKKVFNIVYTFDINEFRDKRTLQILVEYIEP